MNKTCPRVWLVCRSSQADCPKCRLHKLIVSVRVACFRFVKLFVKYLRDDDTDAPNKTPHGAVDGRVLRHGMRGSGCEPDRRTVSVHSRRATDCLARVELHADGGVCCLRHSGTPPDQLGRSGIRSRPATTSCVTKFGNLTVWLLIAAGSGIRLPALRSCQVAEPESG